MMRCILIQWQGSDWRIEVGTFPSPYEAVLWVRDHINPLCLDWSSYAVIALPDNGPDVSGATTIEPLAAYAAWLESKQ